MACPITPTVLFINSVKRRRRSHRLVRDDNQSSLSRRALLYSTERPLGQTVCTLWSARRRTWLPIFLTTVR
jgi:hypothetical protein